MAKQYEHRNDAIARVVEQRMGDGSVAFNVSIEQDGVVVTLAAMGGRKVAEQMAATIERNTAWISIDQADQVAA